MPKEVYKDQTKIYMLSLSIIFIHIYILYILNNLNIPLSTIFFSRHGWITHRIRKYFTTTKVNRFDFCVGISSL